ncbi:MAG: hypothetical protein ABI304_12430 [Rudaea sp.]
MKIQSCILALALALPIMGAVAQDKPADPEQARAAAEANMVKRAEALSESQIKQSHDLQGLTRLAQIYNAQHDTQRFTWVLRRVVELVPNSGDLKMQLALAYAKADDKTNAYDTLIHMQMQGFGYDISKDPRFDPIHGTKVWDYLVANLQVNAKPFGEGTVAFSLAKGDYLFDALAWDATHKQLLAGSARDGKVFRVDEHGKLSDFITADSDNDLWAVTALAVDATHGKLYVASASTPVFHGFNADNANKSGISAFDLATGKLLNTYPLARVPGADIIVSLVVSQDGQVYASDGPRRKVYKLDDGALKAIVTNPKLTNISALTLSDDGRTLYLADYALGIFGYDLTKAEAFEPRYDVAKLVLGGIVGMYWYDGTLAVVQNGMVPQRAMRLQLSKDGRTISGAMPLDVAQPSFADLGSGTVAGDKLYFVANRQDALYDNHGVLTDSGNLQSTQIYRSNLRFAWGQSGVGSGASPLPVTTGKPMPPKGPLPVQKSTDH